MYEIQAFVLSKTIIHIKLTYNTCLLIWWEIGVIAILYEDCRWVINKYMYLLPQY